MICFHFTIFVVLETTPTTVILLCSVLWFAFILLSLSYWKQREECVYNPLPSCDLLSFYYLCRTGNNGAGKSSLTETVVICFHFTIFVVLETTQLEIIKTLTLLWFAFILLSLSYWKQREYHHMLHEHGCDLLSFYYLCRTGNNVTRCKDGDFSVVICFHFTIFVVLETTGSLFVTLELRCDLLSFYYLCRTGNNVPMFLCL